MANRCALVTPIETLFGNISAATYFDNNLSPAPAALNDSSLGYVNGVPVDTGSANNYLVTLPFGVPTNYQQGMTVTFKAVNANTGNSTLTVSPLAAIQLVNIFGNPLVQGDIPAGFVLSCTYNGTAFVVMSPILSNLIGAGVGNFANARVVFDDFFGYPFASGVSNNVLFGPLPWITSYAGAGAVGTFSAQGATASLKAFGEFGFASGTATNGISSILGGSFFPALGAMELDFRLILTTLPSATDNFNWTFGLTDTALSGNNITGFLGTFSATPILEGECISGGTATLTSTTLLTAAAYHRYRILINSAWTQVQFFVDGVQLGSNITTNIPTAVALVPTLNITKTAGTNSRAFYADQFYMSYLYNS